MTHNAVTVPLLTVQQMIQGEERSLLTEPLAGL
jgi:hypothetical protein